MPTQAQRLIEQKMQLRATREFINSHPFDAVFTRRRVERDTQDRGGLVDNGSYELPPQTVRIAHGPPRRRRLENNPPDDSWNQVAYAKDLLIGMPDLDAQVGDKFVDPHGAEYEITYIFQDRDYETVANIGTVTQNGAG